MHASQAGIGDTRILQATVQHATRVQYLVQVPVGYDSHLSAKWPLLVYLHGGSARGSDIKLVKRYGPPRTASRIQGLPFILISPQCPESEIWTDADGLMALIGFVEKEYRVDSGRIYLTGISMGGRGVLYLAYKYPRKFAAVGALAPYSTAWGKGLSATPVLIIHGQNDVTAPVEGSRDLAKAILEANGDVEFRVLPERGHDIANLYDGNEVYDWLLKHRR